MNTKLRRHDHITMMHLQRAWDRAGAEGIDRHLSVYRERRVFELICTLDPTTGRYQSWLSQWRQRLWCRRGLLSSMTAYEQRALGEALRRFVDALPHLPVEMKDAGRYRTANELLDAAACVELSESYGAARRAREREQTVLLADEGGWRLVRLDGPDAARRYGWGTRWCTSSSQGEFEKYTIRGQLFVLITPSGKYQLATGTGEFRDAADVSADLSSISGQAPTAVATLLATLLPS